MTSIRTNRNRIAPQQRMVQQQLSPDFLDPAHEWRRVPGYVMAQMISAIAAALFLRAMFDTVGALIGVDDSTQTRE
jgi:hypothetical protein